MGILRRAAKKGKDVAGTLDAGADGGRRPYGVTAALTATGVGTCGADDNQAQAGHIVPHGTPENREVSYPCKAGVPPAVAYVERIACSVCGEDASRLRELANLSPLRCLDCPEPVQPIPFDTTQLTSPLNRSQPKPGDPCHPLASGAHPPAIAFGSRDSDPTAFEERSPTLRKGGGPAEVAVAYDMRGRGDGKTVNTLCTDHASRPSDYCPVVLQGQGGDVGVQEGGLTQPLRGNCGDASDSAPMIFEPRVARNGREAPEEICPPLKAQSGETGKGDSAPVLFSMMPQNSGKDFKARPVDVTQPIMAAGPTTGNQGGDVLVHPQRATVRRLTPRECERLQGFPDDFTLIPNWKGKTSGEDYDEVVRYLLASDYPEDEAKVLAGMPDGPRYKALGNSFAVPCVRWIGERIQMVEEGA